MDALGWGCIQAFLDEARYPRSKHVLEPYDAFLRRGVKDAIAAHNPIVLRSGKDVVQILVGGDGAEDVEWRQATDDAGMVVTPSKCRSMDLTYESDLVADVVCRWTSPGGRGGEKILEDVRIAGMPTMVHSSECFLRGMTSTELAAAGECPFDEGGYFVVEGQEKAVQAIDNVAHNVLLVSKVRDATRARTVDWEGVVYTKAPGDVWPGKLLLTLSHAPNPRIIAAFDLRASRRVKRSVSMPLFTAFRALGVDTDADIIALIDRFSAAPLDEFLRPSVVDAGEKAGWTGTAAVQYLRAAMSSGQMIRTDDVEAVIAENFLAPAGDLRAAQLAMYVADFVRAVEGDTLVLAHTAAPLAKRLTEQHNSEIIRDALKDALGVDWRLRCEVGGGEPAAAQQTPADDGDAQVVRSEEDELIAEAVRDDDDAAPRRDPEEVALEILQSELGARRIDG